jgi:hypothetical protein
MRDRILTGEYLYDILKFSDVLNRLGVAEK